MTKPESLYPVCLHPFRADVAAKPERMLNPFTYDPHPLAKQAAEELQAYIATHPDVKAAADEGKMFGVLVVAPHSSHQKGGTNVSAHDTNEAPLGGAVGGALTFLAAYSGLLGGRNDWPWFVPPVFDAQQPDGYFKTHEREISDINHEIERLEQSEEYARLKSAHEEAVKKAQETVSSYKNKVEKAKALRDMLRLQRNMSPEDNARLVKESQFMKAELHRIKKQQEALVKEKEQPLREMEERILRLKRQRQQLSDSLQRWLFEQYVMLNEQGERKSLLDIFASPDFTERPSQTEVTTLLSLGEGLGVRPLPPAGSGDCCAPKLLQYAFTHGLKPLCLAEFWWGKPPKTEIRHHLHFYPPCRGKCLPILRWMFSDFRWGEDNESRYEVRGTRYENRNEERREERGSENSNESIIAPTILYEDSSLAVLVKPAGMLSVPGKIDRPSVEQFMRERWHDEVNPLIVHRLDMETSGLMVVARTKWAHQQLQAQFANHEVRKRYEAILDGPWPADRPTEGEISLPLRPDLDDRPRQLVDPVYGKEARTRYRVMVVSRTSSTFLSLFPLTGRTHQLRVHCAHPDGLGLPILGDALYGKPADRLYLHAAEITFRHPKTGEMLTFTDEPDWFPSTP